MKVLVLIIASDGMIYDRSREIWKKYMNSHPNIDSFFIQFSPDFEGVKDSTLYFLGNESFPGIIVKTINSLDYFKDKNYDFIIRTNMSSVLDFGNLLKFLETLPKSGVYCGVIGFAYNTRYISGACIILSQDVCKKILEYQSAILKINIIDDVDIGHVLTDIGVKLTPAPRTDFDKLQDFDINKIPPGNFHYRCKCLDRSQEEELMDLLYNHIYKI